jgi:tripartite-type tricarboxylate transporter receptor subunit TctC
MFTSRVMATALVAIAISATSATAQPQDKFPSRTIRIVVPFAAGGGVDVLARLLAERMAPKMGVNVIIENRAGASGTVGGS